MAPHMVPSPRSALAAQSMPPEPTGKAAPGLGGWLRYPVGTGGKLQFAICRGFARDCRGFAHNHEFRPVVLNAIRRRRGDLSTCSPLDRELDNDVVSRRPTGDDGCGSFEGGTIRASVDHAASVPGCSASAVTCW